MLYSDNSRNFYDVCKKAFGRKIIYTGATNIDATNIVIELGKALSIHWQNRKEIDYLDKYYRGDQPIGYRVKPVRPEINNKIIENHAYEIVEFKTAQNFGEPVQYVRRSIDEDKSEMIQQLNDYMFSEDKGACDIEIGRWRSICGTAYRFIYMDSQKAEYDESPFGIDVLDPRDTFIVYSYGDGKKPMFSVSQRKNEDNETYYVVYTNKRRFEIKNSQIINDGTNGIGFIPVIEYPNNERRLSDIEIVITMLDGLNKMQSDRMNGIEQFVQSFMKFINCDISTEDYGKMREQGLIKLFSENDGKNVDADIIASELNQEQSQIAKDDLFNSVLTIVGMPSREQNTGGDTGQAVYLRNGWDFAEQRAEIQEPIFQKSERQFLKITLNILSVKRKLDLKISDIEIKVTRSKTDNMSVKANVLSLLLASGIDPQVAIKTCQLWSDPESTYLHSKPILDKKWVDSVINAVNQAIQATQVIQTSKQTNNV